MEKPRKIECSLHGFDTKLGCPECGSAYAINETIDAMSTWLEGEVQTKAWLLEAMARGYCTKRNSEKVLDVDLLNDIADEVLLEISRKLTGKET